MPVFLKNGLNALITNASRKTPMHEEKYMANEGRNKVNYIYDKESNGIK